MKRIIFIYLLLLSAMCTAQENNTTPIEQLPYCVDGVRIKGSEYHEITCHTELPPEPDWDSLYRELGGKEKMTLLYNSKYWLSPAQYQHLNFPTWSGNVDRTESGADFLHIYFEQQSGETTLPEVDESGVVIPLDGEYDIFMCVADGSECNEGDILTLKGNIVPYSKGRLCFALNMHAPNYGWVVSRFVVTTSAQVIIQKYKVQVIDKSSEDTQIVIDSFLYSIEDGEFKLSKHIRSTI